VSWEVEVAVEVGNCTNGANNMKYAHGCNYILAKLSCHCKIWHTADVNVGGDAKNKTATMEDRTREHCRS